MSKLKVLISLAFFVLIIGCGEKKDIRTQNTSPGFDNPVREGVIDLSALDQNKDGKLYECPMDYNVIADSSNQCPVCKMDMEEYSVEKIRDNLVKNDFKVKSNVKSETREK